MDKASRVLRRSSVKLLSMGGGHGDLNVLLSEIRDIRHSAKSFLNAQNLAAQDMQRWAVHEENRAVRDVVSQMVELNTLWADVQRDFIEHLKEYRQMFEMVLEGEKNVDQARSHLNSCDQKATKTRKELKKASKSGPTEAVHILESRLSQAERAKDLAQLELSDRIRENEAIKLIRIKQGMMKVSDGYVNMAKKCAVIFSAQRDTASQLPDVHGRELEDVKYTGAGNARYIVQDCRRKLQQFKRSSIHSISSVESDEPPPPYTPPEPNSSVSKSKQTSQKGNRGSTSSNHDDPNYRTPPCSEEPRPLARQRKSYTSDGETASLNDESDPYRTCIQDQGSSPRQLYPTPQPRSRSNSSLLEDNNDDYESAEEELLGAIGGSSIG